MLRVLLRVRTECFRRGGGEGVQAETGQTGKRIIPRDFVGSGKEKRRSTGAVGLDEMRLLVLLLFLLLWLISEGRVQMLWLLLLRLIGVAGDGGRLRCGGILIGRN